VSSRLEHFDELRTELLEWAKSMPDAHAFEERCAKFGLAVGVVRTVRELAESDWAAARGAVAAIPDRLGGYLRMPNAPWHFRNATVGTHGEPRYRGEDNRTVLKTLLGFSDAEIDDLEARNVLSSRLPKS
jgi:crotonobetainyl-CoA:carnitine CoA-transferase CaiB-like acyl-CoA transferase